MSSTRNRRQSKAPRETSQGGLSVHIRSTSEASLCGGFGGVQERGRPRSGRHTKLITIAEACEGLSETNPRGPGYTPRALDLHLPAHFCAAVACKESGVAYGSCIVHYSQAISKDACKAEFEVFRRCFMTSVCRCRSVCVCSVC